MLTKKYFWCVVFEVFIDFGLALCQGQVNTPIVHMYMMCDGVEMSSNELICANRDGWSVEPWSEAVR